MKKIFPVFLLLLAFCSNIRSQSSDRNPGNFAIRGFHLDLRIQPMTMPALKQFATKLHEQNINTLIMEWEASFPFASHPVISNRYAYSKSSIDSFIVFCTSLGIDVIPLQQCFGHVEYILRHYRYTSIREDQENYSQVCPMKASLDSELFSQLFTEMAAAHPSKYFHIGGDETYLLGHCPLCRQKAETVGKSRLYIDYIKLMCDIVIRLGKVPVLWADIAIKYPDAIQELPRGTIFVDWNYGWEMDRFGDHQKLLSSGYEIWGACSMRSHPDNYFLTVWPKHFKNLHDFIPSARKLGYRGMIMTSWSTSGQYSMLNETETEILDLYAIRHVYPITGFNILLSAYGEALRNEQPLDIAGFIPAYAQTQFGLPAGMARQFEKALMMTPYEVSQGIVVGHDQMTIQSLADSAALAGKILHDMIVTRNKDEFEQFRLMADIRLQWLKYEEIEYRINQPSFSRNEIPVLIKQLSLLIDSSRTLDQRFFALNKPWYFPAVLEEENRLRNQKMLQLYFKLSGEPSLNKGKVSVR
jgi:hexosaminidase